MRRVEQHTLHYAAMDAEDVRLTSKRRLRGVSEACKKRRRFEPRQQHQLALFDAFDFVALHADDKRAPAYASTRQHTSAYVSKR